MDGGPAGSLAAGFGGLGAPGQPLGLEGSQDEADLVAEDAQDTLPKARRQLCETVAIAAVLRSPLPPAAADALSDGSALSTGGCAGPRVRALSLALADDEGGALLHLPLMGGVLSAPSVLSAGTAAFESFAARRALVWRASGSCLPPFSDWRALLQAAPTRDSPALVTVPLQASPAQHPLGAATAALERKPSLADVAALRDLGALLAASIQHLTKNVWEESLGFLTAVMPRRVVRNMLSCAVDPRAAPAAVAARPQRARRAPPAERAALPAEAEPSTPGPRSAPAFAAAAAGKAAVPPRLQLRAHAAPVCGDGSGGEGEGGERRGLYPATPPASSSMGGIESYAAMPSNVALPPEAAISSDGGGGGQDGARAAAGPAAAGASWAGCGALPDLAAFGSVCSASAASTEPAGGSSSSRAEPHGLSACRGSSSSLGAESAAYSPSSSRESVYGGGGEAEAGGLVSQPSSARGCLEVKTLRQKWNLEFADPALEEAFKLWFNTLQATTDLAVFRWFAVCLLALVAALALRGGTTLGEWIAVTHSLLSLVVLAAFMLLGPAFYIAHRSTIVACVRCTSAALLLGHVYADPAFYDGSLIKGLAGSGSLTLVTNSFRNRLRFSNHLLVQLTKLYACALANAFTHSDPARAAATYFSLPATTLVQLASAAIPSLAVYRLEAGLRRRFLAAGVQSGVLQMPPAAAVAPTAAALLCPRSAPAAAVAAAKKASSI